MKAFLDFSEVGLSDYILYPDWEIFGKCFPKNLRTTGDTLNQEFVEHNNCFPPKRAYSKVFFPKKAAASVEKTIKSGAKDNSKVVVDKKISEIIETLHKNLTTSNEIKENVEKISSGFTEKIEKIEKNVTESVESENGVHDEASKAIHDTSLQENSNLKFGVTGSFKDAIEKQKAKSKQLTTETIIELEKRLAASDVGQKKITVNDFKKIESAIQETKEKTNLLDQKIKEQKRTIEDFLNS